MTCIFKNPNPNICITEKAREFQKNIYFCFSEVKWKLLSRVRPSATSWIVAFQAPSMGFSRQEYWSGLPFPSPGDLPDPGIKPRSHKLQADSLPAEPQGKPVESAHNTEDLSLIPRSRRSPGEGNGNPLQYSFLENPMDGAWRAIVHRVAKSQTQLSNYTFFLLHWLH